MIVCLCNNVSDRKIRQAVDCGLTSMSALRKELDVATCCGKCHGCAKEILRECLSAPARQPQALVFQALALAA